MEKGPPPTNTFLEIRPPYELNDTTLPSDIEAYVAVVEPRNCGPLVKQLSRILPRTHESLDLSHLKRVKRTPLPVIHVVEALSNVKESGSNPDSEPSNKKRQKTTGDGIRLEVLLGAVSLVDERIRVTKGTTTQDSDIGKLLRDLDVRKIQIPARLPESQEEWKVLNSQWPTAFFPNKTREYREKELQLSPDEIHQMAKGVAEAIADSHEMKNMYAGVVIMSPKTGEVVAKASNERQLQGLSTCERNPLATPILLALQGISRRERQVAIDKGMDSASFQKGQYLCTGYDVYTTLEPTVFEAMALVHARVRRVVFGCSSPKMLGGLVGMNVNALPGTNHHYRAFQWGIEPPSVISAPFSLSPPPNILPAPLR